MKKWADKDTGGNGGSRPDGIASDSLPSSGEGGKGKSRKWMMINKKKPWSLKKKVIVSAVSVLGAVILGVGIFLISILTSPLTNYLKPVVKPSRAPALPTVSQQAEGTEMPVATPTLDPYGQLLAMSDPSILENTVNILLIGVDYAPERDDWRGKKYFHSDVMIVLAVNTLTNEVNLISLPRDTYAKIPGVDGVYKLNASMDCGGGWKKDPKAGCEKVCEAASWMIGGIPIDYYYAVDMTAVKGLVDAIDGVDFNIDMDFKMQGRKYKAGMQHMNGQAVLDYLRVRKDKDISGSGETGDINRINRQKNMLVAIFDKIKSSGLIFKIPDIIGAFTGNLQTNVDLASTAALAAYAYQVDSSNIKMHSMSGSGASIFNWNFQLTSDKKRTDIIKKVYGFDISKSAGRKALEDWYGIKVPSYKGYTYKGAHELWEKMQIEVTGDAAKPYLEKVKEILDKDAELQIKPPPAPTPTPPLDPDEPTPTPVPDPTTPPGGWRQYLENGTEWTLYNNAKKEYDELIDWDTEDTASSTKVAAFKKLIAQLQKNVQALNNTFKINTSMTSAKWTKLWHVNYGDHPYKTEINQKYVENEIPVDFN